jgi:hypothetical protein
MLFISSVNCCLATKPSSLVIFAAVDLLGTMRSLIKDLTYEIEILQLEIDSTDENNNCNIEVSDKVFNTKT